jgi:hypothetical protein
LQFNIWITVNKFSEVELLSNCTVSKAPHKGEGGSSDPNNTYKDLKRNYMSRYGMFIAKALEGSSPLN